MCGAGALTQAIAIGFTLGAVGLFAAPLATELGATATHFNLGVSLFTVVMNLAMPVIGGMLDRGSIRGVMFIGAGVLAVSLGLLAMATALWQVGLLFSVGCAIGMAMLGPMASSTAMANWFDRLRGRALGIANAGGPLGPALVVPVAAWVIGQWGWRTTLFGFAGATLLLGLPLIHFWMIDRPSDVGQYPDGTPPAPSRQPVSSSEAIASASAEASRSVAPEAPDAATATATAPAWDTPDVVRSRDFWFVAVGVAPFAAAGLVMAANAIPYMMHLGASAEGASLVVFVQSCAAVAGPLVFGSLADRIHPRVLFLGLVATLVAGIGALAFEPRYALAVPVFGVVGLVGGSFMPVYGAMIARLFGAESFGRVIGLGALVGLPTLFVAPLGFGLAFDATGGYATGIVGLSAALVIGAVLLACLPSGLARRGREAAA